MQTTNKVVTFCGPMVLALANAGYSGIAAADDVAFYKVTIGIAETTQSNTEGEETQEARLTRFVMRLRSELMVNNLGDANIGCDRCGELVEAEHVDGLEAPARKLTSLEFTLNRIGSQLEAFVRSYDFVQASEFGSKTFTIEIDGMNPPSAACPAEGAQWGCRNRSICTQTNGCDDPYGGSCQICGPP
jgi:hypothetical protein